MINICMNWIIPAISAVGVIVIIAIIVIVLLALKKKKKVNEIKENIKQNNEFLKIFGGKDNIISCEAKGSRLILILNDYSLLDEQGLKDNGVTSMIKATNKITLIVGEKSKELEQFIEENKRP